MKTFIATPLPLAKPPCAAWHVQSDAAQEHLPASATFATCIRDGIDLTKPRIALFSLSTVAAGYVMAADGSTDVAGLLRALLGAGLVAAGAGALNQWMEREADARMRRTSTRPVPAGRLAPRTAFQLGALFAVAGTAYLAAAVNVLAAALGLLILACYLGAYTPLKRRTTLNTAVGAVSGALPPVLGWAAARGTVAPEAGLLFAILFLWQFPHFLAIAWIYRDDYARAGMKMLPVKDATGMLTGCQVVAYTLTLLPVSLGPSILGMTGPLYFLGAATLGFWFLVFAIRFWVSPPRARALLRASLVYLPALLTLLVVDATLTARSAADPPSAAPKVGPAPRAALEDALAAASTVRRLPGFKE